MKKLMTLIGVATMFASQVFAQSNNNTVEGDYVGKAYTVKKDSVNETTEPNEAVAKLEAAADGSYTLVLAGVNTKEQSFNDVKADNLKFVDAGDGSMVVKFEPMQTELSTKDGKVLSGTLAFDETASKVKDNTLTLAFELKLDDAHSLLIFFEGAKPTPAPAGVPEEA